MTPVCVHCRLEMACTRTGFPVLPFDGATVYHSGDRYRCPGCGAEIVASFGSARETQGDHSQWRLLPVTVRPFEAKDFQEKKKPSPYYDGLN